MPKSLCGKINPDKAMPLTGRAMAAAMATPSCCPPPTAGATWCPGSISNFSSFGSGITVPGYGFMLHNRGGLFTLDPNSPNAIAPHKRPYNTLAAGFRAAGRAHRRPVDGAAADGRRHAGPGPCPDDGQHGGSGRQSAGRHRHGALPSQPDRATRSTWNREAFKLVGAAAAGHGPQGHRRRMAAAWAAIRRSCSRPIPRSPSPIAAKNSQQPVNGTYRAGTDHRKDGISVGW